MNYDEALKNLTSNKEYDIIKTKYKRLQDNDVAGAYSLKTDSKMLKEHFDTQIAWWKQEIRVQENVCKSTHAKASKRLSDKNATEGKRLADADEEVAAEYRTLASQEYLRDLIAARISFLESVYFDSKHIWEEGNRKV